MLPLKQLQFGQIVCRIVLRKKGQFHHPAMHDQEHQHVHRPVPGIIELLLFDRPWNRSADRVSFQNLISWNLIDTHHPDALFGKSRRIPIAPKDLLRPLLELGVEPRRLPVPSPMRLQIDIMQNAANRCRADGRDDVVIHRLAGQILAGPVRDVQPLGNRFQASEFNELCPLHRGNLLRMAQVVVPAIGKQIRQASLTIPLAGPPDGGFIALEMGGDRTLPLPSSDSQHDLGSLDLRPGQRTIMSDGRKNILISTSNGQFLRSASPHDATSHTDRAIHSV